MTGRLERALDDIGSEYHRAYNKFGDFSSLHEGYAVLLEEVEELWAEIKKKREQET
ncbi:MAG: hypothetical protein M1503_11530 [Thaumarchaeota archaeon]|nr:hypothetical protein [Nitrososphaerota archaeon]MCL5318874.1 hypothetical protein [Nitrososphaerota archaeon]